MCCSPPSIWRIGTSASKMLSSVSVFGDASALTFEPRCDTISLESAIVGTLSDVFGMVSLREIVVSCDFALFLLFATISYFSVSKTYAVFNVSNKDKGTVLLSLLHPAQPYTPHRCARCRRYGALERRHQRCFLPRRILGMTRY